MSHPNHQLLDVDLCPGAAGAAFSAAIVSLRDQLSVPAQQCLRRDDCGELGQHLSPKSSGFGGQTPALVISEPQTSIAELFAKDTVLFAQVFDHLKLAFIHPSGKGDQEKPETDRGLWACTRLIIDRRDLPTSRPAT
jgi:hypothetical protein